MTPHGTLEDMASIEEMLGDRLGEMFAAETWASSKKVLSKAVHFDFGAAWPLPEHVEFGADLLARGIFRLPFPEVFYSSQALKHSSMVATLHVDKDWFELTAASISPALEKQTQRMFRVPSLVIQCEGESWEAAEFGFGSAQIRGLHHLSDGRPFSEEDRHDGAMKVLRFLIGATAMMMSRDIEVAIEPAPAKLNAIRTKKGKIAVGERRIIRIKPEHRKAYADAATAEREGRSPRMHLRRGHFRTLRHERFGTERVVPVAPSIVNGNDDARPLAKTYQVEVA